MRSIDRINTFWSFAFARSAEGARLRRRLAATAALTTLLSGLLIAIGLGIFVLAFCAVVCAGALVTAAARVLPAYWPLLRSRATGWIRCVRSLARRFGVVALRLCEASLAQVHVGAIRTKGLSVSAIAWLRVRLPAVAADIGRAGGGLAEASRSVAAKARRLSAPVKRAVTFSTHQPVDRWREALRLNAAATGLRRNGSYAEAAKLHRSALGILEQFGDRRAVALTLNNLALAVSHLGKDTEAVTLFEEAATILRQLGDEEHEGRVIANLGLIHRRRGRYEESDDVLQLALTKLTPASSAYRTVEAELRRAG